MAKEKKQDNSPKVHQREKIKDILDIRPFNWTEKQQKFIDLALDKKTQIVICKAPPGVGKTLLATYCSLELLSKKAVSSIIYLRNPMECIGKGIGYIPGDLFFKMEPYSGPLYDHLNELLAPSVIKKLVEDKRIEIQTAGYCKGLSYHNIATIMDEASDLTFQDLRLIISRMGKFSKLFVIGDEKQTSIKNSGFDKVYNMFNNQESRDMGIITFEFTNEDCMRSPFLRFVLSKFDKEF